MNCPAEIVIEKPHRTNNFKWCWAVCQPDANWGAWFEGSCESREDAERQAVNALRRVNGN